MCTLHHSTATGITQQSEAELADLLVRLIAAFEHVAGDYIQLRAEVAVALTEAEERD